MMLEALLASARMGHQFDVRGHAVLGAEVKHLLRFGNSTDQRTGKRLVAHDQRTLVEHRRLRRNTDDHHRTIQTKTLKPLVKFR